MATQAYIDGSGFPASGLTITNQAVNSCPIPVSGTGAFQAEGGLYSRLVLITCGKSGDTGYGTGGYALTPSQFGLNTILGIKPLYFNTAGISYLFYWNAQTNKLMVFSAVGTQVTGSTDIHSVTGAFEVIGI